MTKIKFELDAEQVDDIVRQTLINDYRSLKIDNRQILQRGHLDELPPHVHEDYYNNLTTLDGLEAVMKYYVPHLEVESIIKEEEVKDEFAETADDYAYAHGAMGDWDHDYDRINDLEEKVRMLEKQIAQHLYNTHVDL